MIRFSKLQIQLGSVLTSLMLLASPVGAQSVCPLLSHSASPVGTVESQPALPLSKIVIDRAHHTLILYQDNELLKEYPVGVGRKNFPTPQGTYSVIRKIKNPGWEHPYKKPGAVRIKPHTAENPLGTRWIGFMEYKGGEYGIHGTNNPSSVGKYSSHGCVRMNIKDAEDLYDKVEIGTPVIIH